MATDYLKPPRLLVRMVDKVRRKYYSEFKKAKIVILVRTGKWRYAGTLARVSKQHRALGIDGDYLLTINHDAWEQFSMKQKRALVDHELHHMAKRKAKDGSTRWLLRQHDVEEFTEIVKRYGAWTSSLSRFRKAF